MDWIKELEKIRERLATSELELERVLDEPDSERAAELVGIIQLLRSEKEYAYERAIAV
jgi:hypothetical protein